ncbi:hypothetical protein C7M84_024025 [Penaeus vannamei]|uniref:Uncharacterized protein n=1 Tax=Penaeus vannamei TaxID=6689 RepID=A0A3R7MIR6_PENVA|nr:hypothetical protein C7M84_024025 [Penaeus vannamei]
MAKNFPGLKWGLPETKKNEKSGLPPPPFPLFSRSHVYPFLTSPLLIPLPHLFLSPIFLPFSPSPPSTHPPSSSFPLSPFPYPSSPLLLSPFLFSSLISPFLLPLLSPLLFPLSYPIFPFPSLIPPPFITFPLSYYRSLSFPLPPPSLSNARVCQKPLSHTDSPPPPPIPSPVPGPPRLTPLLFYTTCPNPESTPNINSYSPASPSPLPSPHTLVSSPTPFASPPHLPPSPTLRLPLPTFLPLANPSLNSPTPTTILRPPPSPHSHNFPSPPRSLNSHTSHPPTCPPPPPHPTVPRPAASCAGIDRRRAVVASTTPAARPHSRPPYPWAASKSRAPLQGIAVGLATEVPTTKLDCACAFARPATSRHWRQRLT